MEFIKGMDLSFVPQELERGAIFKDEAGNAKEPLQLLKENGVNSVRLRLWNEPSNVPESGGYCDLKQTIAFAKKIKEYGMSFLLDFHYSDWWADPGQQRKPKAWQNLSFEELKEAVYQFTKDSLLAMKEEGVYPDFVQVGNEIRSGMLFPEGEVPNYKQLVQLVNSGIGAVRETGEESNVKVLIHLDQGGRFYYLRDWFDAAMEQGLADFDMIALSYYPFWHGTFSEFRDTLEAMVDRYQKPIVIAEAAHPWRCTDQGFVGEQQEKIIGFPATPNAQEEVLKLIMYITASVKKEMGLGVYYWEPMVLPRAGEGGWSENMGIFDEEGKALPCLKTFQFERKMAEKRYVAKIYEPKALTWKLGSAGKLPEAVKVLYSDGCCKMHEVTWKQPELEKTGHYEVTGLIDEIGRTVSMKLDVVEQLDEQYNYIRNGNFENGLDDWVIQKGNELVKAELHGDFIDPFPAPPVNHVFVEGIMNFTYSMSQRIELEEDGEYQLSVEYKGTNTTGVNVTLGLNTQPKEEFTMEHEMVIYPTDEEWIDYSLEPVKLSKGMIQVGLNIQAPPVYGRIRNFRLTKLR